MILTSLLDGGESRSGIAEPLPGTGPEPVTCHFPGSDIYVVKISTAWVVVADMEPDLHSAQLY
jgi:hypothetical protein